MAPEDKEEAEEEEALEGGSAEANCGVAPEAEEAEEAAALEFALAEASRGVAPEEEEEAEEEAALEGGSAEASGVGLNAGGQRSRVGASGGPMEPRAASTTTEGQVHDLASTEFAVQTVAAANGSEAGGGGTAVVEETAQGVALEEEEAEEAAALASVSVNVSGGGMKTASSLV